MTVKVKETELVDLLFDSPFDECYAKRLEIRVKRNPSLLKMVKGFVKETTRRYEGILKELEKLERKSDD